MTTSGGTEPVPTSDGAPDNVQVPSEASQSRAGPAGISVEPPAGGPNRFRYDAFISHSHEQQELAAWLQRTLHRLGRRWYQLRRLNVFRDVVNLSPGGSLPTALERALGISRYLVLLASEQAAESRWVDEECRLWLAAGGDLDRLVVVLVNGTRTTSLPPSLRELVDEDWLIVDIRGLSSDVERSVRRGKLFDAAAGISAKLQGIDKEELVSEDYRNRRRALSLAISAVAFMAVLVVAAVVLAWVAFDARADALLQRDAAASRAVANTSRDLREANPELSRKLAVAAYRIAPTAEAGGAVVDSVDVPSRVTLPGRTTNLVLFGPDPKVVALQLDGDDASDIGTHDAVLDLTDGAAVELPDSLGDDGRQAFGPDSTLLATLDGEHAVKLWSLSEAVPQLQGRIEAEAGVGLGGFEFSPAGGQLAVCHGDGSVRLYDVTDPHNPRQAASLTPPGEVTQVQFSDDGALLAMALASGRIVLADTSGPAPALRAAFDGHDGTVYHIVFSPDGTILATSGYDDKIRLWSTRADTDKPLLAERYGAPSDPYGLIFSQTGRVLLVNSASLSEVTVHDLDDPTGLSTGTSIAGHAVAVSADRRLMATATIENGRNVLHVWDIRDPAAPRRLRDLPAIGGVPFSAAFSRDGSTFYTADQQSVDVWDLARERNPLSVATLEQHTDIVTSVKLADSGRRMLTASWDGTAKLYDTTDPSLPGLLGEFTIQRGEGLAALSPNGGLVAVNDRPDHVALWDVTSGKDARPVGGIDVVEPTAVEFDPGGGSLAIGTLAGAVEVWSVQTSGVTLDVRIAAGVDWVNAMTFAGQTGVLAVAGFNGLALWDLSSVDSPRLVGRSDDRVIINDVAFDHERNLLASADNSGVVLLWVVGVDRLEWLARVETGQLAASSVAFDVEAARLVMGSGDGRVKLVSVLQPRSPVFLGSLAGHGGPVNDVATAPAGLLASGSNDRSVMMWSFDITDVARYICRTNLSSLSRQEWEQYIPDVPFRAICDD